MAAVKTSIVLKQEHWEKARQIVDAGPLYRSIGHIVEIALDNYFTMLEKQRAFDEILNQSSEPRQAA